LRVCDFAISRRSRQPEARQTHPVVRDRHASQQIVEKREATETETDRHSSRVEVISNAYEHRDQDQKIPANRPPWVRRAKRRLWQIPMPTTG
jgi:hypothetical protein